jgi:hypothetical protein
MTSLGILQTAGSELAIAVKSRRQYLSDYHSGVCDGRVIELVFILRSCLPSAPWPTQLIVGLTIRETLNLDATK